MPGKPRPSRRTEQAGSLRYTRSAGFPARFRRRIPGGGFTLVELLVVLAIIATLLSLAAPRYFQHVERSREAVLKENLATLRDAIDQYRADKDAWPANLQTLAEARYIRRIPVDPITERSDTWIERPPAAPDTSGMADVSSGAPGTALDGTAYADW